MLKAPCGPRTLAYRVETHGDARCSLWFRDESRQSTHECAMPLSFFMREHFKALMFDRHKQHAAPISKASVHTSVNAARMSACATMISTFYGVSPKTK